MLPLVKLGVWLQRSNIIHSRRFIMDSYDSEEVQDEVYISVQEEKFGASPLVVDIEYPKLVRRHLDGGAEVSAGAIQAACLTASAESLDLLLAAGGSPDARLEHSATGRDDAVSWPADVSPNVGADKREWYPLHHATIGLSAPSPPSEEGRLRRVATIETLLKYKPNLYATYAQPIWPGQPCPIAQGDPRLACELLDDYPRGMHEGEWTTWCETSLGKVDRSVLHALLEDGALVSPILDAIEIDGSRRDPQGRTRLHSVCRNALGCDALPAYMLQDSHERDSRDWIIAPSDEQSSLFHIIRLRGMDLRAVDNSGKNVLHHLLEARTQPIQCSRPPWNKSTLTYVLETEPSLLNQCDAFGTYPLHAALQRLRSYQFMVIHNLDLGIVETVHYLLDAGAHPAVSDSRGNTPLHYLATCGLAEREFSRGVMDLCGRLCKDVDVDAVNQAGSTAMAILMNDNGDTGRYRLGRMQGEVPTQEEVDKEVFGMFDGAGFRWDVKDADGRTALHGVAMHATRKAGFRARYLIGKGLNGQTVDGHGKSAVDLARDAENMAVLEVLKAIELHEELPDSALPIDSI